MADRRLHLAAGGVVAIAVAVLLIIAAMPWGAFRPTIEAQLSKQFDRPVKIAQVERIDSISFVPTIELRDVRVPQAAWAGTGDFARIGKVRIRVPIVPLLFGRFDPRSITLSDARVWLVRDAARRTNWTRDSSADTRSDIVPTLDALTVADTVVDYRDALQDRHLTIAVLADPVSGLQLAGRGTIRGAQVKVAATAPAVGPSTVGRPWPFHARIDGKMLAMDVRGMMNRPLDISHLEMQVEARADDLKLIDAVIEAGLFATQPVRLSARARRDGQTWKIDPIRGSIGRSDIAGTLTVVKGQRTNIEGRIVSNELSFDDFASDAGRAAAIALEKAEGLKLVPNTRINIRKIDNTDGVIAFDVRRLVGGRRPSSLTSLKGRLTLDRQLMTVSPLTIGLKRGAITGVVEVDQRGGRAVPTVTLDLTMRDSSISALVGGADGEVDARVDGRGQLRGAGSTIREAVGASNGSIGLVAKNGSLPAKIAALIGFDVARGLTTDKDERAGLRCLVAKFVVNDGRGRAEPLIIDTTLSQSRATGTLTFPSEAFSLTLTGAPKQKAILRLPGSVSVAGTIRAPDIVIPRETKSIGNIFKAIGRSISGDQEQRATDANCAALAAQVLR
ncbi:AsmA family protein [Sphingoaurantiacus capsulatus]|uniref:AsmA family protein n=1 Tax=Sphingoaurantiacus capsulatus TaxID=1771310 RepID=A0ABV7X9Y1_9SPHN